jgi:hypothetical protein
MSDKRIAELEQRIHQQAIEIRQMQVALERKNRLLDALHLVWCDGGCRSGVHRWTDELVTGELVELAERNTRRLRRWYDAVKFRLEHYNAGQVTKIGPVEFRASEWHENYARRNAEKTDLA